MILLDGKKVAELKTKELQQRVLNLNKKPVFYIIQVGDLFESNKYINNKIKKGSELFIDVKLKKFEQTITENELISFIKNELLQKCDGIIVQLPLPDHINKQNVLDAIDPLLDVDGLSSINMNNFYNNHFSFTPATARAILMLLKFYKIDLINKNIIIIGESNLVGKPIKHILSQYSKNISSRNIKTGIGGSETADVLIVAAGCPKLVKKVNVKEQAVIVDVGINRLDNKHIVGDVDFEDVKDKVYAISPVPGGVGPLTVISLFENLIEKCEKIKK